MKELFNQIVMRLALCGLAASFAVLAFRSWPVRAALVRLSAIWRGLTAFGRFAVCAFLFVGVLEADKTNNVNNLPPQQMMAGGGSFLTGFTGLTGLPFPIPHSPLPILSKQHLPDKHSPRAGLTTGTCAARGRTRFGWDSRTVGC